MQDQAVAMSQWRRTFLVVHQNKTFRGLTIVLMLALLATSLTQLLWIPCYAKNASGSDCMIAKTGLITIIVGVMIVFLYHIVLIVVEMGQTLQTFKPHLEHVRK